MRERVCSHPLDMDEAPVFRRGRGRPSFYDTKIASLALPDSVNVLPSRGGVSAKDCAVKTQFSCDECGKCCRSNWALKSHRRRHTAEKPFSCVVDGCCKSFRTSGDRLRHLRVHSGLKNYGCDVVGCAASFTTSANLRTHKSVVHEGSKNFTCEICGKMFGYMTSYRNHVRIHTGEKQYSCSHPGCASKFTEYSTALKHALRVHTVIGTFKCPKCTRVYRSSTGLSHHMRAIHQGSNQNQGYSALEDDVRIGQNFPGKLISSAETSKAVDTESNSARKDIPNFALSNDALRDLLLQEIPHFANLVRLGGDLSSAWCGLEEEREAAILLGFYEDERDGNDANRDEPVVELMGNPSEYSGSEWNSDISHRFHDPSLIETFPELLLPDAET